MILPLLVAASIATAPTVGANSGELLAGASHAISANRLDQAEVMISRAVGAGASGSALKRVIADLAFARGNYAEALALYRELLPFSPRDQRLLEPAAIAAMKLGELDEASRLLGLASSGAGASWRVWNASGVLADLMGDWAKADHCYDEAMRLAPSQSAPVNNRGWSLLLRGNWTGALSLFEKASILDPNAERVRNNLELARSALALELPKRMPGEPASSWAARLNDAGVAAAILGDRARAVAAFTRALQTSGTWYARAESNLEALANR